jgi:hypothetical protein
VSVVAAPAATLLLLAIAIEVASEALVASVLAGLVTLSSCLVSAGTSKTAILATGLSTVESVALEVAGVPSVAGLLRLRRREGRSRGSVCGRSRTAGLGKGRATSVGTLGITEWFQVVACSGLGALLTITASLVCAAGTE